MEMARFGGRAGFDDGSFFLFLSFEFLDDAQMV